MSSLACVFLFGIAGTAAAACDPDGDVEFLCGPVSPEDLIAVPQSPWVIVSSMEDEGHLYLADTRDHAATVLFPTGTPRPQHDTATYGACSGPPTAQFRPHGLSLQPGNGGTHTLYVVGHGAREAGEVFRLDISVASPTLTWIGCVVRTRNGQPQLGCGSSRRRLRRDQLPVHRGELWEWHRAAGWAKVPGSATTSPNGIVVSTDGRWFLHRGMGHPVVDSSVTWTNASPEGRR